MKFNWLYVGKAFSYRLLGVVVTMLVVFVVTGQLKVAGIVGLIDAILKLVLYYFHEILWEKIKEKRGD